MAEPAQSPYEFAAFDPALAARIAAEAGIPVAAANLLARRGIGSPDEARAFLAAETDHGTAFPDMARAVTLMRETIAAGARITVHGDYDADGVCATAILVEALRSLGADCDWFIPSRIDDGYGLDERLPDRLAERGTSLLVSVDCGIGSAPVISGLRAVGIEAIVTDHHQPPEALPECPVLHPAIGYPFAGLCGAGVAAKLAEALCGEPRGLDLAALATVADSVPLLDENRRIVRQGLGIAASTPRPGLRTLMAVARVEPERLSARDVAFRLAPRINAAGRLYRADAAVELLLCEQVERAAEIAEELDRMNGERRAIESEVVAEAQRQAAELTADGEQPALVLAGEGWHPGVVGIAASRMVDRHGVPVLMIAIDETGTGTGSGRTAAGIDLLGALGECAELLGRFGGHKAAAGLEIPAERIGELRRRFADAVARQAEGAPRTECEQLDGVLAVSELDLALAQGLEVLGPFGQGNPEPTFLVAAAVAEDVQSMGEGDRHARLMLRSGAHRASAVAFDAGDRAAAWPGAKLDAIVRLEVNHWNGSVSARTVIDSAVPALASIDHPCCAPAADRATEYVELVAAQLDLLAERRGVPPIAPTHRRSPWSRPGRPAFAALTDLVPSGRSVIVVTADARRRASLAGRIALVAGSDPLVVCSRCARSLPTQIGAPLITDWATLAHTDEPISAELVAAVDPAPGEAVEAAALAAIDPAAAIFALWGPAEAEFALACLRDEADTRGHAAAIYRGLRAAEPDDAPALAIVLGGESPISRTPAAAARALRVLADVGLVDVSRDAAAGGALEVRVVSSARTDLDRSEAYRRFCADHQEGESFLSRQQRRAA